MDNKVMEEKAVSIVTIKAKHTLYKGVDTAERIELIELEENGFNLVSQKDLYQVGDKAVYIQPDYNLSDIPLFESFLRPGGDITKSMLGKVNGIPQRIRAKKFIFSKEIEGDHVYSNGILLPLKEVCLAVPSFMGKSLSFSDSLGITKWEEPEMRDKAGNKIQGTRAFPEGLYKTDETNINNLWNHIENKLEYPVHLIGTEKVDGSSITIGVKNDRPFICSRNMELPLIIKKHVGRREKTWVEKLLFWTKPNLNLYKEVPNESDFIKYGKSYLDRLIEGSESNIVLRGELNGSHLKGSGNKNNPYSKEQPNIKFFGADIIDDIGIANKMSNFEFKIVCIVYDLPTVKEIFNKTFNNKEEIIKECEDYFKDNLTEGIVLKTKCSAFSAKYMCLKYDSYK